MEITIKETEKVNEKSAHKIVSYAIMLGFDVCVQNPETNDDWINNYHRTGKLKIKRSVQKVK